MINTHLTTLEQSKVLYDRGLRRESNFVWYPSNNELSLFEIRTWNEPIPLPLGIENVYPAYLLSELMEMLPNNIQITKHSNYNVGKDINYKIEYRGYETDSYVEYAKNPVQAVVSMLCWLHDNKIINLKEL